MVDIVILCSYEIVGGEVPGDFRSGWHQCEVSFRVNGQDDREVERDRQERGGRITATETHNCENLK